MRLCIDPGHGQDNVTKGKYDPGAQGGSHSEADLALTWALTGKYIAITEYGIDPGDIVMTRETARDSASIRSRAQKALSNKCTHFLSIHCNSNKAASVSGTEVLYPSKDRSGDQSDDIAWAKTVLGVAVKVLKLPDRGPKDESQSQHSRLAVFNSANHMKACLLELGFISNEGDRKAMLDREVRIAFWRALFEKMGFKPVA